MNINEKSMIIVLVSTLFLWAGSPTQKAEQQVMFELSVPEGLLQPGDRLELRGDISPEYTWDAGPSLQYRDGLWHLNLDQDLAGTSFEYKYVIVRTDGRLDWEEGKNRNFNALGLGMVRDQLRGFDGPRLHQDVSVLIELDLGDFHLDGHPVEKVGLLGGRPPLGWDLPEEAILLQRGRDGLWSTQIVFTGGQPADIPFKFGWQVDGVWHWQALPGHIDHLLVLNPDAARAEVRLQYDDQTGRIRSVRAVGGTLDAYGEAAETYKETRRYRYFRAIELLDAGNMAAARRMYQEHRRYYEPVYIDDFDFIWAQTLKDHHGLGQALAFTRDQAELETNPWRKAYFHYLEGELLLNDGRLAAARGALQQALELAPDQDSDRQIVGYAQMGLAMSWMGEHENQKRIRARVPLLQLAHNHPDERERRKAWDALVQLGHALDDRALVDQGLQGLSQTGSPRQRNRSMLERLEFRMDRVPADSTAAGLAELENKLQDDALRQDLLLIKVRHLQNIGHSAQAREILQKMSEHNFDISNDRTRQRLRHLEQQQLNKFAE